MTTAYKKNNHFHIVTGEIWDLESMQDVVRDIVAPHSVEKGQCNIVIDLSQLSERHIYNKPFVLSVKRFIDTVYGVKISAIVIPDDSNRSKSDAIMHTLTDQSTNKTSHWIIAPSYTSAQTAINKGI